MFLRRGHRVVGRASSRSYGQAIKPRAEMPGKQGVLFKKDPAHEYWEKRGQGTWSIPRFKREASWGLRGYIRSHFAAPPAEAIEAVRLDPARAEWDKQLRQIAKEFPQIEYLVEQWLFQNQYQALGGNQLPVKAGEEMIEGLRRMGRATTLGEKLGGHWHAQIKSLGGNGFRGGASYLMHALAIPVQWPAIAARHFGYKYLGIPENFHPIRNVSRKSIAYLKQKREGRK